MRSFSLIFTGAISSIFVLTGCTSFSATIIKPDDDAGISGGASARGDSSVGGSNPSGGASGTGGVASTIGGTRSASTTVGGTQGTGTALLGGSSSTGGALSSGGASNASSTNSTGGALATGGAASTGLGGATGMSGAPSSGGTSSNASASNAGGLFTTGGASATGGAVGSGGAIATGGTSACTEDRDCINPDPTNCSYTCVNPGIAGTCKPSVLTSPTRCATDDCAERAISGFWSNGKPYIAYGFTETDGSASIRMQQLKGDGTPEGGATKYDLSPDLDEPDMLSAAAQGSRVAFVLTSTRELVNAAPLSVLLSALTDTTGKVTAPTELEGSAGGLGVSWIWADVTDAGAWLVLRAGGHTVASWDGVCGSSVSSLSPFESAPVQYGMSGAAVAGTVMLTGGNCATVSASCSVQSLVIKRYSAAGLMSIGTQIVLSQEMRGVEVVMGALNGQMSVVWTDSGSPGQLLHAVVREDAASGAVVGAIQSAIRPKAIAQSRSGGALLIGTIAAGTPAKYQLVAQRLDPNLNLVGNPLPVANSDSADVTYLETDISDDGDQVLITYRQTGAKYRLISTDACM